MNGLMGLSGVGVLSAASKTRIDGGFVCPALAEWRLPPEIGPLACESRQKGYDKSRGTRRHLCLGMNCLHYQGDLVALGTETEAGPAPRCGCGEPLEAGVESCPDCLAEAAHRTATRRPRSGGSKEESMARITKPAKSAAQEGLEHGLPLPEGATVQANGKVRKSGREIKVCPAGKHWQSANATGCVGCGTAKRGGRRPKVPASKPAESAPETKTGAEPQAPASATPYLDAVSDAAERLIKSSASIENAPPPAKILEHAERLMSRMEALGFEVGREPNGLQSAIWDECEAMAERLMARFVTPESTAVALAEHLLLSRVIERSGK